MPDSRGSCKRDPEELRILIGVHQPNFLPWTPYFIKIAASNKFIFLDDVQFTKGDYINRSEFGSLADGRLDWLTQPVYHVAGQSVREVQVAIESATVIRKIIKRFQLLPKIEYPFLDDSLQLLETICTSLSSSKPKLLMDVNVEIISRICSVLMIETELTFSSDLHVSGTGAERLRQIQEACGGDLLILGEGFSNYGSFEGVENVIAFTCSIKTPILKFVAQQGLTSASQLIAKEAENLRSSGE